MSESVQESRECFAQRNLVVSLRCSVNQLFLTSVPRVALVLRKYLVISEAGPYRVCTFLAVIWVHILKNTDFCFINIIIFNIFFNIIIFSRTAIARAIIGLAFSWFFTIQRFWIVLGRCLFIKICSHFFMIFEVKLELWFWSRRNRKWSEKASGIPAWNIFALNLN